MNKAATSDSQAPAVTPPPDADGVGTDAFLDSVFDAALDQLQTGGHPDAAALASARPEMLAAVREQVAAAAAVLPRLTARPPRVPGYVIEQEIGRGGMGTVYLARQSRLQGRLVALKVLSTSAASSESAAERFRREWRRVASFRDAGIVMLLDVPEDAEPPAFAMQWVEGMSLAAIIGRLESAHGDPIAAVRECLHRGTQADPIRGWADGSFNQWVAGVGLRLARTLARVHASGMSHRDVKPSNILFGADAQPLLSDFGLALDGDDPSATIAGQFVGTPAYAAPEQLRGGASRDGKCDVYGLGATLYHLLCRRPPHTETTLVGALAALDKGPPIPARRLAPTVPSDLDAILAKALEPDPADRYSATELADDLERLLTLRPIAAQRAGPFKRLQWLIQRNRSKVAGAIWGAIATAMIGVALVSYLMVAPRAVSKAVREARLSLLDPTRMDSLGGVAIGLRTATNPLPLSAASVAGAKSASRLRFALRLAPWRSDLRAEAETIEAVVRAADRGRALGPREVPAVLREENPFTAQYLTTLGNGPLVTIPAGTGPTDLYLTGLAAFVYGDVVSAAIAWDAHAGMVRPSPFMEAALAEGDFIRRDWPLLYTRLDKAVQEFPDTAYLTVAFADAALHVGRIEEAGRLIALAQTQIPPDPSESHRRVLAEYLAARGDHAAAIEHFEFFRHRKRAPAAREAYGRYLLAQGRFLDAATIMHEVYIVQPLGRYGPLFHATANAWMQRADAAELEIARTGRLPGAPFAARMLADWQRLDEAGATAPFPALLIAPARSKADGSLPPPSEWWVQDMKRTDGSRTTR